MYLRYLDMLNKNIFDQNKEYLPNTCIHVFEVLRTWSTKINIFLIKIKNTFQIRVFMYLRYLDMLNKNSFSKIKNTSEQIYNRINIFYHVFGHVKKDSSLK